jgi:hypothetical protein
MISISCVTSLHPSEKYAILAIEPRFHAWPTKWRTFRKHVLAFEWKFCFRLGGHRQAQTLNKALYSQTNTIQTKPDYI